MENRYLEVTEMLNYGSPEIQSLIIDRGWKELDEFHRIKSVYEFVQNEILFGYNQCDELTASQVLSDGIGQCNTKAILLMALLRAVTIPCRLHGFNVTKDFQKGAINPIIIKFTPQNIVHTWVEVYYDANWFALEGVILDKKYLSAIQHKFPNETGIFKNFAVATNCFECPKVDWKGEDTYIQKEAVVYDYGLFASPDDFFSSHSQDLCKLKKFLYSHIVRRVMTRTVAVIRNKRMVLDGGID